jgi:hypothetical protein
MVRRLFLVGLMLLLFCAALPAARAAAQGRPATNVISIVDSSCSNTFKAAAGSATVTVCPTVVESGQILRFTIHAQQNEPVTVQLRYPNGLTDSKADTTDDQGIAIVDMVVRYNPLYRYGQAQFTVIVGTQGAANAEVVAGVVRVAQSTATAGKPRLRVRPAGAKEWCPESGRCTVRNRTSILIRVDTSPNAQVQCDLAYPNGVTLPCPGNELAGGTGAFADSNGTYQCTMPISYDLPNAKASVAALVQATITTSADTIPVQYKLWIKGK